MRASSPRWPRLLGYDAVWRFQGDLELTMMQRALAVALSLALPVGCGWPAADRASTEAAGEEDKA